MKPSRSLILAVGVVTVVGAYGAARAAPAAPPANEAILQVLQPQGENLLKAGAWKAMGEGFRQDGDALVCDNAAAEKAVRGAVQTLVLNQSAPTPIVAEAWSKADGVGGGEADSDYSLYLDLLYMDGTPLWGQVATFRTGTHDWQHVTVRVFPAKPVKSVTVNLLLRRHAGKAYFKDARLASGAAGAGAELFDGLPVLHRAQAYRVAPRFMVRDVAADSDFIPLDSGKALGLKIQSETKTEGGATFITAHLEDTTGKDRAVTLVYAIPLKGAQWQWLAGPRTTLATEGSRDYQNVVRVGSVGSSGQLGRYPFAALARGKEGQAIGIDLSQPAFFRTGYSVGTNLLYIAYDLALTPEKKSADVRLATWTFAGSDGFRGAVARMYELFPDQFRSRTPEQGIWMPFHAVSKVKGWEDFGFKFKEGNDETAWDNAHGLITFRYTEPMTWWMTMPKEMPRTLEAALAEAKRLAAAGKAEAKALATSGFLDESGRVPGRLRNEPWCNGIVWSMNSMPGVAGEVTDFKVKWNPALRDRLYGAAAKGGRLSGEYIDSSEGYVTDVLDFRRDHFAAARTPLVFSSDSRAPAVFRGLIAFEYSRAIADDVHALGRLMMANATPDRLPWLTPLFDVLGTETDWNPGGRWQPMSDDELLYRRVLCGPKPYCFLMNTEFDRLPPERVEKYMKRCLAYGMFPGFFSANASEGHYFSRPELYDRDRPLFKKYVPLVKLVAEAGWQPLTRAWSSDAKVYVERFGKRYLTVFNDSPEERSVTITIGEDPPPQKSRELVAGAEVTWTGGPQFTWTGGKTTLKLGPEDVAVIDLAPDTPLKKVGSTDPTCS
jgi:hypothetical protein